MNRCKQCGLAMPMTEGKCAKVYCSDKCRMSYNRSQPRTEATPNNPEQATPNTSVEQCVRRAAKGKSYRKGDPVWPYTRHLNPVQFVAWCKVHRASWLTSAKPGDADYNWDESGLPEQGSLQPA